MSVPVTAERLTAEAFHEWVHRPENANRSYELVRGEVVEMPLPTKPHGVVCTRIASVLDRFTFDTGKSYVSSNDAGVILERGPDTVRGPDVAVYDDAASFEEIHPKFGEVPPLVAVEVLSPEDRPGKVLRKISDYLNAQVRLVWVVDPEMRQVMVYRPQSSPVVVEEHEELKGEDVLPGFRCLVCDLFRLPAQKRREESPAE